MSLIQYRIFKWITPRGNYIRAWRKHIMRSIVCQISFKIGTDTHKYLFSHVYVYRNTHTYFTFTWPCIVANFFIIKQTRYTNFTNLFCFRAGPGWNCIPSWSCSKAVYKPVWNIPLLSVQWINSWWCADELSETCRVSCQKKFVKLVHLVGFIIKKHTHTHTHTIYIYIYIYIYILHKHNKKTKTIRNFALYFIIEFLQKKVLP